ncbi:hypothetical protein ACXVYK_14480 [Bacillus sp. BC07]
MKSSPGSRKKVAHILEVSAIFQKYLPEVFGRQQHLYLYISWVLYSL